MKPEEQRPEGNKPNVPQPKTEIGLGAGKRDANIDDRSASGNKSERLPGRDENLEEHDGNSAPKADTVKH